LLTVLAFLHWHDIRRLIGSDIDPEVLSLAARNLALVTLPGLEARSSQLVEMYHRFGKDAHAEALASVKNLKDSIESAARSHPITTYLFEADSLDSATLREHLIEGSIELVITDVPYGQRSTWTKSGTKELGEIDATWQLLEALHPFVLSSRRRLYLRSRRTNNRRPDMLAIGASASSNSGNDEHFSIHRSR